MKYSMVLALVLLFEMSGSQIGGLPRRESADATTAALDRVIEINLSDATLMLALSTLAIDHRIPIGFEHAIDSRDNPNRQIHLKSGTLKSILDSLVAQEPRYKWELRDGAINITPVLGRDRFLAQLLLRKKQNIRCGIWRG